jgi:hypothetical protein
MILIYSPLTARYARVGLTRLVIVGPFLAILPLFWPWKKPEGMLARGLLSVVAVTTILISVSWLLRVRTSPFSLDWDEGNRLYDYSQYFAADRYLHAGPIDFAYSSLGRHGLWGLPFLIDGLPIWIHRLWDAIIRMVPAYLVGWLLVRHEESRVLKAGIAGAFGIFLLQERIYSTLLLSGALVFLVWKSRYSTRALLVIPAGLYASLSRWTWTFGPASWAAIIDVILFYPEREGSWFRRLLPTSAIWLLGAIPGVLLHRDRLLPVAAENDSLAFSQPLLWYRLLPSETYPEGILIGFLLALGPPIAVLGWLIARNRWSLDIWQRLVVAAVGTVFLAGGFVASVKIGGGNDLHNMDLFIITVLLLAGLAYDDLSSRGPLLWDQWPSWVRGLLVFSLLIASWNVLKRADVTILPESNEIERVLQSIKREVRAGDGVGEVLFMDQRQLLTFGYLNGVTLVDEYEKKYLMDMAMADNQPYFEQFYRDLKNRRFELIVSHPLKVQYVGKTRAFGLEDDAWTRWVAEPVLCYYKPIRTYEDFRIMLLEPRAGSIECGGSIPD